MNFSEINNKYTTSSVRWGIVRNKNLSNQLDSATIVLTQVSSMNIEPYDLVQINNEDHNVEYWLVGKADRDYITYQTPYKFDYTVDLMSLTKFLETITLPSMAITNIGQNRSIKSYIQRVMETYVLPKLSVYISSITYTGIDDRFNMTCPEMTFTQTTAREYLDWMANIYGCCIQLTYKGSGVLDVGVLDMNPNGTAIDTSIINSIKDTQSAQDYVTELEHDLKEVIGQNTITEYIKFKGDGYIFNSENAVGILSHKPYHISKVVLKSEITIKHNYDYHDGGSGLSGDTYDTIRNIDITKYVVTEEEYSTLELPANLEDNRDVEVPPHESDTASDAGIGVKYKTNCIYWTRGDNHIKNINYYESFKWFFGNNATLTAFESAVIEAYLEGHWVNPQADAQPITGFDHYTIDNYAWDDMILEVTYTPYISPRLLVEQRENFSHIITMPDNSTNTQTEIGKFLSYSLEKNSKLGNKSKILIAKSDIASPNPDYTPKLAIGQFWKDENNDIYILSSLEYSTYPSSIIYKGTLTKNYTNQNIFTAVNREKRYFSLPSVNEVVERKEVIKEYYQVKNVSSISGLALIPTSRFTTKPLFMSCRVTLADDTKIYPALVADTTFGGNLIAHSASFIDNVSYGSEATEGTNHGVKMVLKKYVDDNGEATAFDFSFRIRNSANDQTADDAMMEDLAVGTTPLASQTTALDGSYRLEILKDAREKISLTVEKIIYSGADNVIVGDIAELFNNTSELIWLVYVYNSGGLLTTYDMQMAKTQFLGGLWRLFLPNDTRGVLYVRKNRYNTASTYLTIKNYNYGDYIVFLSGTKRG